MKYELTLASYDEQKISLESGGSGVFYDLGAEIDRELRHHPLAVSELGRPKRIDAVHLSISDKRKDIIRWMGRGPSGFYRQIGRAMRLIPIPEKASK